jgi:hypothetical protein
VLLIFLQQAKIMERKRLKEAADFQFGVVSKLRLSRLYDIQTNKV